MLTGKKTASNAFKCSIFLALYFYMILFFIVDTQFYIYIYVYHLNRAVKRLRANDSVGNPWRDRQHHQTLL